MFTQQHCPKENNVNEETNGPTAYGKYVDECLYEAAKHFFSEGEDKYTVADLFYAGIRCGQTWLEKQGGQKSTDKVEPFDKYEGLTDFERALADICIGWIGEELGWKQYIKDNADVLLKIAVEKFNSVQDVPFEQKPAWSKEDEKEYKYVLKFVDNILNNCGNKKDYEHCKRCYDWLKSLRPQNNITDEELAQAKKDAYNDALDKIEYHSGEPTFDDGWSAAIWYLKKKNAMPQTQWKPSDEQMEALKHYVDTTMDGDIDLLYQDLKELKGE